MFIVGTYEYCASYGDLVALFQVNFIKKKKKIQNTLFFYTS